MNEHPLSGPRALTLGLTLGALLWLLIAAVGILLGDAL